MSPMRPDEFGHQDAYRWLSFEQFRGAYQEGVHRANTEAAARAELERDDD